MNVCITFGGAPYDVTTKLIFDRATELGSDDVRVYDDLWLAQQDFYTQNQWLWQHPHKRGFGWYAWKPFIIWHALLTLKDGDVVLYIDADCVPIADHRMLYDQCRKDGGVMLFASEGHRQYEWCKMDCYVVMGQEGPEYYNLPAGVARFMLFQKGPWKATQVLMEWLTYCVNPLANTFDPSTLRDELSGFVEHRAEQAILTNLAHKYKLNLYREADESGMHTGRDRKLYGQLFQQINADVEHVSAEPIGSMYRNVDSVCVR